MKKVNVGTKGTQCSVTFPDGKVIELIPGSSVELDDDKADILLGLSSSDETSKPEKEGKKGGDQK